jgi:hypothetical protein
LPKATCDQLILIANADDQLAIDESQVREWAFRVFSLEAFPRVLIPSINCYEDIYPHLRAARDAKNNSVVVARTFDKEANEHGMVPVGTSVGCGGFGQITRNNLKCCSKEICGEAELMGIWIGKDVRELRRGEKLISWDKLPRPHREFDVREREFSHQSINELLQSLGKMRRRPRGVIAPRPSMTERL